MNYLKQLLDVKGITCQDISAGTGYGYHSVQKTVKGHRRQVQIRNAIATFLGLDPTKAWGKGSMIYLRRQVAIEANLMAAQRAESAKKAFLAKYTRILPAKAKAVNV